MDNKELEGVLLYAGVGLFILFMLFSLFSVWANGVFFSWLTVKYVFLMGAAAVALVLEDAARRRYAIAFAAFLGLLAYSDLLTYSHNTISTLAESELRGLQEDKKELEEEIGQIDLVMAVEEVKAKREAIKEFPAERFESESERTETLEQLDKDLQKKQEELEKALAKIEIDDAEELGEIAFAIEKEERLELKSRKDDLRSAKGYDAFILLGGFLMLAGALIGGAPMDENGGSYYGYTASNYTPPQAPAGGAAPAATGPTTPPVAPPASPPTTPPSASAPGSTAPEGPKPAGGDQPKTT